MPAVMRLFIRLMQSLIIKGLRIIVICRQRLLRSGGETDISRPDPFFFILFSSLKQKELENKMEAIVPIEVIEKKIYLIRGHKVMLSMQLAELYGVETRVLNQAVKRNIHRFPEDFMFQINESEAEQLVSQNVIPHKKYFGGSLPYAFTEQGVAMLSSILNSEQAIKINIAIMRAFVKLREMLSTSKELAYKFAELERKIERHDEEIKAIFDAIRQLMAPPPETKKKKIGFVVRERSARYRTLSRKAVKW
ncbi:MAG: ORF6N domain-containing protein [Nitrospirota bacterium]